MLRTLLESGPGATDPRARWTTASVLAHAALIAAAVGATMVDAMNERPDPYPETPIYIAPPRAPEPAPRNPDGALLSLPREGLRIAESVFPPLHTLLLEEHRLSTPELFDPPGGVTPTAAADGSPRGGVFPAVQVERTVVPRADNPPPEYPRTLRESNVEGEVLVRFVVDSTGRVEAESIVVLQQPHALFGDAVRRWLPRTRYRPAEIGGQPVRQLVEQRIAFALRP
jgi:TonB family protein